MIFLEGFVSHFLPNVLKKIIVKIFDIHIKPSAENMSRIASGIRSDFSHPKIFIMNST